MPIGVLPPAARALPKGAQKLWLNVHDEELVKGKPEADASRIAWAAVKRSGYSKNSKGEWRKFVDSEVLIGDDDSFVIGVPIQKVNAKTRTVAGYATCDSVDGARDIVDFEASKKAFSKWAGNIREMHNKKAVGKAVGWEPSTVSGADGENYNAIWVEAKISKGAEDTWQKVLDGTLSGFSVGGTVNEKERELSKVGDEEVPVWRITDYTLGELSLVDVPCNALAQVALVKSIDGALVSTDELDESDVESVEKAYESGTGKYVDVSAEYARVVEAMEALRDKAVERNVDYLAGRVSMWLDDYRRQAIDEAKASQSLAETEISGVFKSEKETEVEVIEKDLTENTDSDITIEDEFSNEDKSLFRKFLDFMKSDLPVEEAKVDSEVEEIEKDGVEMDKEEFEAELASFQETLAKGFDEKTEAIGESLKSIAEALEKVATSEAVDESIAKINEALAGIIKRVEALESAGAVKKSADVADVDAEVIEKVADKGLWSGNIVPEFLVK